MAIRSPLLVQKEQMSVFEFVFTADDLNLVVRKPAFGICENKGADQLRSYYAADQRICFRYIGCTIPLFSKSEVWPSSVAVQPGLCRTWSETPKTGFLTTRLIFLSDCDQSRGCIHFSCAKSYCSLLGHTRSRQTYSIVIDKYAFILVPLCTMQGWLSFHSIGKQGLCLEVKF